MEKKTDDQLGFFDALVLVLSFYVLIALVLDAFHLFDPETERLVQIIDNIVCALFLVEFSVRFYRAESKLQFMKWGWIDLLASIPMVDAFRVGRLVRVFRVIRVLRAFRSATHVANHFFRRRAYGTMTSVGVLAVLLVLSASVAILQLETDPESNIRSAEDALWWSYVTITTVGYGDKYPVTAEGRIVAVVLMTAGVGLFGTFTALVASWFVASDREKGRSPDQ